MLADHRLWQERIAQAARRRAQMLYGYGEWFEELESWCWFLTITFRNGSLSDDLRGTDTCAANWTPLKRRIELRRLRHFFQDLQKASGSSIAWVLAENLGQLGDRFHVHGLVAGVDHVPILTWQMAAVVRFGRCEIKKFETGIGGGRYIARNALAKRGDLHFGGTLAGQALPVAQVPKVGRIVVAHSADVPSSLYRMTLGRKRKR